MTLISDLKNISKNVSGKVLVIGLENKTVEQVLDKNENIIELYTMKFNGKKKIKDKSRGKRGKSISIKKIRKIFKKKRIDYIICNIEDINKFLRTFIRDSIYINKSKLYIYGTKENLDIELIENRYKRYNTSIIVTEYNKDLLMEIDNSNAYNNKIKDIFYNICDIGYNIVNTIGDLLIN